MGLDLASLAETVEPIKGRTVISVSPVGSALEVTLGGDELGLETHSLLLMAPWSVRLRRGAALSHDDMGRYEHEFDCKDDWCRYCERRTKSLRRLSSILGDTIVDFKIGPRTDLQVLLSRGTQILSRSEWLPEINWFYFERSTWRRIGVSEMGIEVDAHAQGEVVAARKFTVRKGGELLPAELEIFRPTPTSTDAVRCGFRIVGPFDEIRGAVLGSDGVQAR